MSRQEVRLNISSLIFPAIIILVIKKSFFLKIPTIYIINFILLYVVVKTMAEQKFCNDCKQKHDCQEIYKQLGDVKGPSVVIKVIVAFLLPLLVFIVSLAIFERILSGAISTDQLQTALSLLAALLITFICILIVRVINRRFGQVG
jgi:uncharacterized membrane protein